MVSTKKSFGNVTLAGIFAAATLAAAVPAFASTTITWNFNNPTGALGTSENYTGTVTGSALPSNVTGSPTITANGYTMDAHGKNLASSDLYGKDGGTTEQGLGMNSGVDNEISIDSSGTQYYIQLDLTPFLTQSFFQSQSASLTIGSLQSPDMAELWVSGKAGDLGTNITNVKSASNQQNQSVTVALSDFTAADPYLTVSTQVKQTKDKNGNWYWCGSQYTPESVLLDNMTINIPGGTGGGSPAPVPATAGLTLAGALGMGLMVLVRRRRNTLNGV